MNTIIASLTGGQGPLFDVLVSVSVTLPAAISAAVGVYLALSDEALGLYEPAPPLHVPLEAPPLTEPPSWATGLLAHTFTSEPAFTIAMGLIVIFIWSLSASHGPMGSFVVSVSVTLPAAISAADGV
jgi:hypothetical protein